MCAMVVLAVVRAAVPTAAVRGIAARAPSGIRYVNTTDATIGVQAMPDLPWYVRGRECVQIWSDLVSRRCDFKTCVVNFYFFVSC
jgi:hypothetical protein